MVVGPHGVEEGGTLERGLPRSRSISFCETRELAEGPPDLGLPSGRPGEWTMERRKRRKGKRRSRRSEEKLVEVRRSYEKCGEVRRSEEKLIEVRRRKEKLGGVRRS